MRAAAVTDGRPVGDRALWHAVAVPSEHGGWGLTAEPVLLGLLVAFSWPGVAIGVAAMLAFLIRTPLKLALVDRRRRRSLPRTRLAWRIAAGELAVLAAATSLALAGAGWRWTIPLAVAVPLFVTELWFDVRSRGRRLLPELCGAAGITAVAAAIVVAGDGSGALAVAVSLILAARAIASIPYVRTQIERLRHGSASTAGWRRFQVAGVLVALSAVAVERQVAAGAAAVLALVVAQVVWSRRPVPPARALGMRQLVLGLIVVAITALGVHA